MNIDQLERFYHSALQKSITAAAEQMNITPQGMSRSIKALEKELDVELLEKKSSGVTLNAKGEELLPLIKNVLDNIALIENKCNKKLPNDELKGKATIYTTSYLSSFCVGPMVVALNEKYPKLQIQLYESDALSAIESFFKENKDGIFFINISQDIADEVLMKCNERITLEKVYSSKVKVVMSAAHNLSKGNCVTFKQLSQYPIIINAEQTLKSYGIEKFLQQYGKIKIKSIYVNMHLTMQSIVNSDSISFVFGNTEKMLDNDILDDAFKKKLKIKYIKDAPEHFIYLAYDNQHPNSAIYKEIADYFKLALKIYI